MIITFLLFLATFRSSVALSAVFFFLVLTFMMLAVGEFTGSCKSGLISREPHLTTLQWAHTRLAVSSVASRR
jgi:hypothetical protein